MGGGDDDDDDDEKVYPLLNENKPKNSGRKLPLRVGIILVHLIQIPNTLCFKSPINFCVSFSHCTAAFPIVLLLYGENLTIFILSPSLINNQPRNTIHPWVLFPGQPDV